MDPSAWSYYVHEERHNHEKFSSWLLASEKQQQKNRYSTVPNTKERKALLRWPDSIVRWPISQVMTLHFVRNLNSQLLWAERLEKPPDWQKSFARFLCHVTFLFGAYNLAVFGNFGCPPSWQSCELLLASDSLNAETVQYNNGLVGSKKAI